MTPRVRVGLLVALAAAASAGIAVGATVLTRNGSPSAPTTNTVKPRPGAPPLALDLGVRPDAEARALRRAGDLYLGGKRAQAAAIFARYASLQAKMGAAFAAWGQPGALQRVEQLARANPNSAFAQLHLGLALFWAGRPAEAQAAWRAAVARDPDTDSAVRADDLLHPNMPRGRPLFVTSFQPPKALERLAPDRELAALAAAARKPDVRAKLLYGVALQRLGRPVSAERQFAAAAALAPKDAEAQTAAAVGRFDKDHPERAFSRLGPLTRVFPHAATVRFHLGIMLLWLGQLDAARSQLRLARAEEPHSPLGGEARRFLVRLEGIRTK